MGRECCSAVFSDPHRTKRIGSCENWAEPASATRFRSKLISSPCLTQSVIRASSGLRATDKQGGVVVGRRNVPFWVIRGYCSLIHRLGAKSDSSGVRGGEEASLEGCHIGRRDIAVDGHIPANVRKSSDIPKWRVWKRSRMGRLRSA